jgi:hypothetical protein
MPPTDAAIDFDGACHIPEPVRRPLIESVRRFQLGESGDGLQLLTVAEVVALSYHGGLAASAPDPVVRAVAARIVADEHSHVRLQRDRLRTGFAGSGITLRLLAWAFWWMTAIGATVVVAFDHGPQLDAIGYRRTRFVRNVLVDFAKVAAEVLQRRTSLLAGVNN